MNLAAWLEHIQKIHPRSWDLGLERVGLVAARMQILKPAAKIFMVAGTNGKGSTCEVLAQLCAVKGLRYGKATSPFLRKYNEQIIVNGLMATDAEIIDAFIEIDQIRGDISLTYFEFSTLAALTIFNKSNLDVVILEVGLGGRLDAMNIVDADVAIITQIAVDHETWLGVGRENIAREKAGIVRQGKACVVVDESPPQSLLEYLTEKQVETSFVGRDFTYQEPTLQIGTLNYDIPDHALPLPSVLAAINALIVTGYTLKQTEINSAVGAASLPGRYQVVIVGKQQRVILDVAHNPNAAQLLIEKLVQNGFDQVQAIVSMYVDKDMEQIFKILAPVVCKWHFPSLTAARSASKETLNQRLSASIGSASETYDTVAAAWKSALVESDMDKPILVFGSFSIVAEILNIIETNITE